LADDRFQDWMLDRESDECYERVERMKRPFLEWINDLKNSEEHRRILEEANGPSATDVYGIQFGIGVAASRFFNLPEDQRKIDSEFHFHFLRDFEYGEDYMFGIIPPEQKDFYRYDDIIDYYSHRKNLRNTVEWLDQRTGNSGVYPHTMMVRIPHEPPIEITPEDIVSLDLPPSIKKSKPSALPDRLDCGIFNRLVGLWDERSCPVLKDEVVARCKQIYRPEIFASVLLWTHYVGVFKDWAKTVNQLRPCIYTYWS